MKILKTALPRFLFQTGAIRRGAEILDFKLGRAFLFQTGAIRRNFF